MNKKITQFDELPGNLLDTDYVPVVREGKNYKTPGNKVKADTAGYADEAGHAGTADNATNAGSAGVAGVARAVQSVPFVTGPNGAGMRLYIDENGKATGELDNLSVRGSLAVNELSILKMRSIGGTFMVTNAIKIKDVSGDGPNFTANIDTDSDTIAVPFVVDDIIVCKTDNGIAQKYYQARVTAVNTSSFMFTLTAGSGLPDAGDELLQVDNYTVASRRGIIKLTNTEAGAPFIEVLQGIVTNPANALKVRMGMLDGIVDPYFGPLSGPGFYGDNVYIRSLRVGGTSDVYTKEEVDRIKVADRNLINDSLSSPYDGFEAWGIVEGFDGAEFSYYGKHYGVFNTPDAAIFGLGNEGFVYPVDGGALLKPSTDYVFSMIMQPMSAAPDVNVELQIWDQGTNSLWWSLATFPAPAIYSVERKVFFLTSPPTPAPGYFQLRLVVNGAIEFLGMDVFLGEGNRFNGFRPSPERSSQEVASLAELADLAANGQDFPVYQIRDIVLDQNDEANWNEIEVYTKDDPDTNKAPDLIYETSKPLKVGSAPLSSLYDGDGDEENAVILDGRGSLTITVEEEIAYIAISRNSELEYKYLRTQVTADGVNWITIYDSRIDGVETYKEFEGIRITPEFVNKVAQYNKLDEDERVAALAGIPIRYIKDQGISSNTATMRWTEIKAINGEGINVAEGCQATTTSPLDPAHNNLTSVTDGNPSSYVETTAELWIAHPLIVDLGEVFTDIKEVIVTHFASGADTVDYYGLFVSADGIDWTPLYGGFEAIIPANVLNVDVQQGVVSGILNTIAAVVDDGKLAAQEKPARKKEWRQIANTRAKLTAQAAAYLTSSTAYQSAYQTLANYLNGGAAYAGGVNDFPLWLTDARKNIDETVTTALLTNYTNYYNAQIDLQNALLDKAKQIGEEANRTKESPLLYSGKYRAGDRIAVPTGNPDVTLDGKTFYAGRRYYSTRTRSGVWPDSFTGSDWVEEIDGSAAMAIIDGIVNDNVLSRAEKPALRKEWKESISVDRADLPTKAATYGVSSAAYISAYNTLANYLNGGTTYMGGTSDFPLWLTDARLNTDEAMTGATLRTYYLNYYTAQKALVAKFIATGGVNLLQESAAPALAIAGGFTGQTLNTSEADKFRRMDLASGVVGTCYTNITSGYSSADPHVLSVWVRHNAGVSLNVQLVPEADVSGGSKTHAVPSGQWVRIFTNQFACTYNAAYFTVTNSTGGSINFDYKKLQLEKYGLTDWKYSEWEIRLIQDTANQAGTDAAAANAAAIAAAADAASKPAHFFTTPFNYKEKDFWTPTINTTLGVEPNTKTFTAGVLYVSNATNSGAANKDHWNDAGKISALRNVFTEEVIAQNGIVMAGVLGAKIAGVVRSYMNGNPLFSEWAIAAGVDNFGVEGLETVIAGIKHNGAIKGANGGFEVNPDGSGQAGWGGFNWSAGGTLVKIAGFTIDGSKLFNTDTSTELLFDSLGDADTFLRINKVGSPNVLSIGSSASGKTALSIVNYGSGANGLYVLGNDPLGASGYAIQSYGNMMFGQRSGETWNAPGVLAAFTCLTNAGGSSISINQQWKITGLTLSAGSWNSGSQSFVVTHNLGHTDYVAIPMDMSFGGQVNITGKSGTGFTVDYNSATATSREVGIMIIGRNGAATFPS